MALFKNPEVQDLSWVMASPPLLNLENTVREEWCASALKKHHQTLIALDQNPEPLRQFLAQFPQTYRLGLYFERLVEYWLREILGYSEVQSNVRLYDGTRTLGALDFLFQDLSTSGQTHWETAIKFYLCLTTKPRKALRLDQYWGPYGLDRFDLKLKRLLEHQLPLGSNHAVHSQIFMKGMLFYPLGIHPSVNELPVSVSPRHEQGWWCYLKNIDAALDTMGTQWALVPKMKWLSKDLLPLGATGESFKKLCLEHFAKDQRSIMVRSERGCGFIVHNQWP